MIDKNVRYIKDLNKEDNAVLMDVFKTYLFGKTAIREFSEEKIYSQRDVAIFYDEDGQLILRQPLVDNITGPYDDEQWAEVVISEMAWRSTRDFDLVLVSNTQPTSLTNRVWLQPVTETLTDDFEGLVITSGVDFMDAHFAITDKTPLSISNIVWMQPLSKVTETSDFDDFI